MILLLKSTAQKSARKKKQKSRWRLNSRISHIDCLLWTFGEYLKVLFSAIKMTSPRTQKVSDLIFLICEKLMKISQEFS